MVAHDARDGVKAYKFPNEDKIETMMKERNFSLKLSSADNPIRTSGPLANLTIDPPSTTCEVCAQYFFLYLSVILKVHFVRCTLEK